MICDLIINKFKTQSKIQTFIWILITLLSDAYKSAIVLISLASCSPETWEWLSTLGTSAYAAPHRQAEVLQRLHWQETEMCARKKCFWADFKNIYIEQTIIVKMPLFTWSLLKMSGKKMLTGFNRTRSSARNVYMLCNLWTTTKIYTNLITVLHTGNAFWAKYGAMEC